MKILFLTDNFPPESNAPATRTYEHCIEWVKKGAEVTVITCAPNFPKGELFPGYKNKWKQEEMMDGIRVIRVWSYITPNRGLLLRIVDYMSFCITAFLASLSVKTDVIVATSPQLFTALSGYLASVFKRTPWVMEVRDLWPESIKAVQAMRESVVLKILDRVVLFLYRKADRIVVVTDGFKERMTSCGIDGAKIRIVKNGVHLYKFEKRPKDNTLIEKLNLQGKFIIGYIGTHGMAHNLSFILDAVKKVKNKEIHFLFIGEGAMKTRLLKKVERLGLQNVSMLNAIPKDLVPQFINIIDVALIPLRKSNTFKKVLPSKIFENAAMEKPILLGVEGEAKDVIEKYQAGLCFEPENQAEFLMQLEKMHADKEHYQRLQKGCAELAVDFDRKVLADKMYTVLGELVHSPEKTKVNVEVKVDG